jgi:arsenate reductase-like glutaredoxin family protein
VRAWLHEKAVDIEERDFFQNRFSEEELRQILQGEKLSDVFSWNSPRFKALGLSTDGLNDEALLQLMLKEPRLIRRPLVKVGERLLIIGGSQQALDQAFQ